MNNEPGTEERHMKFLAIQIKKHLLIDMGMNIFIEAEVEETEETLMTPLDQIIIFILLTRLISLEPSLEGKILLVFL